MKLTLREVLAATGGTLLGEFNDLDVRIPYLLPHTNLPRNIEWESALFTPYIGAHYDGHDFIEEAFDKGCIGCLTERELPHYRKDKFYVLVNDVASASWQIAKEHMKSVHAKIICVTGSVGKTTTTRMVANTLRQKYSVFETLDNQNSEQLVPSMLCRIDKLNDYAVIELGLGINSNVKEMARQICPDMMVLTNIGYAHVEKNGSLAGTAEEKCGATDYIAGGGTIFINGDDVLLKKYPYKHLVVTYGIGEENDVRVYDIEQYVESFLTYSALATYAVGKHEGMTEEEIRTGISTFIPERGRMDFIECNGFTLIDSTFNASPASMKLALDTLGKQKGLRIAVLGEIVELGDYRKELYEEVGSYVTFDNTDIFITVGENAKEMLAGQTDQRVTKWPCRDNEEAFNAIRSIVKQRVAGEGCTVLCKGSNAYKLYELSQKLVEDI